MTDAGRMGQQSITRRRPCENPLGRELDINNYGADIINYENRHLVGQGASRRSILRIHTCAGRHAQLLDWRIAGTEGLLKNRWLNC
jgi:hypothetical protein